MLEINLHGKPPSPREIEEARADLENSRLLVMQNELHVAGLYKKLLLKMVVLALLLLVILLLYFILPPGMFGVVNGRAIFLGVVSVMLVSSMSWIGWKTVLEARSVIPGRGYSKKQLQLLEEQIATLADIDTKQRLNIKNWSRRDGVLYEYMKQVVRQHRLPIGIEYDAVKAHIKKTSMSRRKK